MQLIALRHQVAVYQQSITRPKLRSADRLLWVWLSRLGSGWQEALEFVQPRTVIAWQKKRFRDYWRRLSQLGQPGRPAISKEVRELIQDMWRASPTWGSPRIRGELRKLGITCAHPPDCASGARHMRDPALLLREDRLGPDKCAMIIYGVRPSQHQGAPRRDTKAKETMR
jgi:hypothetical protein